MTGRDLIVYILKNNLENERVFKDGRFIGFVTAEEAAVKTNAGVATVYAWIQQGRLDGIFVGDKIYIPADFESPVIEKTEVKRNE